MEKELLETMKPNVWNIYVEGNMEQKIEVDFRMFSISVIDYLGVNMKEISAFDFYASVQYLRNKFKKDKK